MISEDGSVSMVFNGEIFNYVELRRELEQFGHTFATSGDSEVLLKAYVQWGGECFGRMDGMFACAMLDLRANRLVLARDRLGIKPLYHARHTSSGAFLFGSEGPLLARACGSVRADARTLYEFLKFGISDHGTRSFFSGVSLLAPGHVLELSLDDGQVRENRSYWTLPDGPVADQPLSRSVEQIRELFLSGVDRHLRSDVPVGILLSGGIDSSAILFAARRLGGRDASLRTYSFLSEEGSQDTRFSRLAARKAGSFHTEVRMSGPLSSDVFHHVIRSQGEPFVSLSILAQYMIFERMRMDGVKVCLSGQGADELFAGYLPMIQTRGLELRRSKSPHWKRLALALGASRIRGYDWRLLLWKTDMEFRKRFPNLASVPQRPPSRLKPEWVQGIADARGSLAGFWNLHEHMRALATERSLPRLLRYEDRNAMAWSVENRVPFLSGPLAECALSLPSEHLISPLASTKHVLRRALVGIVPRAIVHRRDKVGFMAPDRDMLLGLADEVERALRDGRDLVSDCLDMDGVSREWAAIRDGSQPYDTRLWRWLSVILWAREFNVEV